MVFSAKQLTDATSCRTSGKGLTSLPIPPLRTVHESFPSHGSSLSKALLSEDPAQNKLLLSLYDTHLQLFHIGPGFVPVDAVPILCLAGRCTRFPVHLRFRSFKSSANSLVKKDLMEVGPLSRGMMLQPLSVPITGSAFAFSIVRYPHFPWASLAVSFPACTGESTGLPRSASINGVG